MADAARYDRIVVGAGMSGLADAWYAHRAGARVRLLEMSDTVGGVIGTTTTNGYRHERAATSIPSSASALIALLEDIGRADLLVPASDAAKSQYLLTGRGLTRVPRSPPSLMTTRLLTLRGKLRALGELTRGRGTPPPGETLHAFVTRRFGREIADTFLRAFTNGIYGSAPERLGAADAFPRLVALEQRRGGVLRGLMAGGLGGSASAAPRRKRQVLMPKDGMASIPQAIADALGDAVETGAHVESVEPGSSDAPARVHLEDGRVLEADQVVLAGRNVSQAYLVEASHPEVAATLRAIDYVPMIVASVGYAAGKGPALPEGFGFLRGPASKARILGATFNSRLNPDVAPEGASLLTAYIGGSEDRAASELPKDVLRATVLEDLGAALGGAIEPDLYETWHWPAAIPAFVPGHRARMAAANAALSDARIHLLGSHVTGVSLNDCCRPSAPVAGPLPSGLTRIGA